MASKGLVTTVGETTKAKVRQDMTTVATKSVFTSVIIALFVHTELLLRSLNTCSYCCAIIALRLNAI